MSLQTRLKTVVESLPESVGRCLSRTPFVLRLGPEYARMRRDIQRTERIVGEQCERTLFLQLRRLLETAFTKVEFYREFYAARGFALEDFRSVSDWERVPIVTKADMQPFPLRARSVPSAPGLKVYTGGTSGQPLDFLVDNRAWAREWAHMHHLWMRRGYRPQHVKLTLRGRHYKHPQALRYNAVHNEYLANSSYSMAQIVDAVVRLPNDRAIRWIHGYPSLVAEFVQYLAEYPVAIRARFRSMLYGILLASEYPAPVYREEIERELSRNTFSWYGHSEMAVLAGETAVGVYESASTYGYAEAVEAADGGAHRLVVTSLHNHVHPFIRYDTGDRVEPVSQESGRLSFRISEGRVGDFIVDRHGSRHALTGLIFGRHHSAFELLRHLQVRDDGGGRVTLLLTPRKKGVSADEIWRNLDVQDLDIDWQLEILDEPVRSAAGKILLKVSG